MKLTRKNLRKLILQEMRHVGPGTSNPNVPRISPAQQELLDLQEEFDAKLETLKEMAMDPALNMEEDYFSIINTIQEGWGEQRYNADALRQANALMDSFLPYPDEWVKDSRSPDYRW